MGKHFSLADSTPLAILIILEFVGARALPFLDWVSLERELLKWPTKHWNCKQKSPLKKNSSDLHIVF